MLPEPNFSNEYLERLAWDYYDWPKQNSAEDPFDIVLSSYSCVPRFRRFICQDPVKNVKDLLEKLGGCKSGRGYYCSADGLKELAKDIMDGKVAYISSYDEEGFLYTVSTIEKDSAALFERYMWHVDRLLKEVDAAKEAYEKKISSINAACLDFVGSSIAALGNGTLSAKQGFQIARFLYSKEYFYPIYEPYRKELSSYVEFHEYTEI